MAWKGGAVTLAISAARTATDVVTAVTDNRFALAQSLLFVCDVTAQSGTTPTLDVEVHAQIAGNYTEILQFSRFAGVTGTKLGAVSRGLALASELTLAAAPAVAGTAFNVNNLSWGDTFRISFAIGGTTPSFTFSVTAYPIYADYHEAHEALQLNFKDVAP